MNERVTAPYAVRRDGARTAAPTADGCGNGHDEWTDARFQHRRAPRPVVIADRDPIARRGMGAALGRRSGFVLVGEVGSPREAVGVAVVQQPELVVMDASLPGPDCIAAVGEIARRVPGARVVALSTEPDDEWSLRALRAGAWGWLPKTIEPASLRRALRRVLDGEVAVTRALATHLVEEFRRQPDGWRPVRSRLTSREWEVIELLSDGASTNAIAERLVVAPTTVYSHVNRVLHKLAVHSRAEAVVAARILRDAEAAADA